MPVESRSSGSTGSTSSPPASAAAANAAAAAGGPATPAVQLFQRAHQKISRLARLDEQVMQLLGRRRRLQEELRAVQAEINEEFERLIRLVDEPPPALRGYAEHIAPTAAPVTTTVSPAVRQSDARRAAGQFASHPIDSATAVA